MMAPPRRLARLRNRNLAARMYTFGVKHKKGMVVSHHPRAS